MNIVRRYSMIFWDTSNQSFDEPDLIEIRAYIEHDDDSFAAVFIDEDDERVRALFPTVREAARWIQQRYQKWENEQ